MKKIVLFALLSGLILSTGIFAKSNKDKAQSKEDQIVELISAGEDKALTKLLFSSQALARKRYGSQKGTLLHTALEANAELSTIKILLKAGVDPAAKNSNGENAVLFACKQEASPKITEELIRSNAFLPLQKSSRILSKSKDKKNAFDYARNNDNLYELLLKYAKDPSPVYTEAPEEPVELVDPMTGNVMTENQEPETEAETVQEEAEPEETIVEEQESPYDETPAEEPVQETVTAPVVPEIVENADEEYEYETYRPIYLFDGLEDEEPPVLSESEKPVEKISNPDKRDEKGRTDLMKACAKDDLDSIRQLIYSGADSDALDKDSWTPLMYAARHSKNGETIKLLLAAEANPELKNRYRFTALEIAAAYNNSPEVIQELISCSDKKTVQKALVTAITQNRNEAIIQKFMEKDVSVNFIYKGMTPLMYACKTGTSTGTIRILLENGASKTIVTAGGKNAFSFAEQNFNLPHDSVYWSLNKKENN